MTFPYYFLTGCPQKPDFLTSFDYWDYILGTTTYSRGIFFIFNLCSSYLTGKNILWRMTAAVSTMGLTLHQALYTLYSIQFLIKQALLVSFYKWCTFSTSHSFKDREPVLKRRSIWFLSTVFIHFPQYSCKQNTTK